MARKSFRSRKGGMGTRRGQKPSRFFVAAGGGSRGVFLPHVCKIRYIVCLFGNSIHVTIVSVSNRHCISLWGMVIRGKVKHVCRRQQAVVFASVKEKTK